MKKTLNSTKIMQIILHILLIITAIVLAIVMNKWAMRDDSTMDEAFIMGLLSIASTVGVGVIVYLFFSDGYIWISALIVLFSISVVTVFFGLIYNSVHGCHIYNAAIITAIIETVIASLLFFIKKPKQENGDKNEDEDEDAPAPDTRVIITISVRRKPLS